MAQTITAAVKAAFNSQIIERDYKCLINWISGVDKTGTITANEWDATYGQKEEASDDILKETPKRPFILSDSLKLSDSPYFLRAGAQIGWLGNTRSDASGDFAPSQNWQIIYDSSINVKSITVIGASYSYPVDFDLSYRDSLGAWQLAQSYSGVTSETTIYEFGALTEITGTKIEIDKISAVDMFACVIEIDVGFEDDISGDIISMKIKKESEYEKGTIDIGNISANEFVLILDNAARRYNHDNASSEVADYIKANKRIEPFVGVEEGGVITFIPQGIYYIRDIIPKPNMTIEFRCLDSMGLMNEQDYEVSQVAENKRIDELFVEVVEDFGLDSDHYNIDTTTGTIPYSFFEKRRYAFHVKQLAEGEGGVAYFDEKGILQFKNRDSIPSNTIEKFYGSSDIIHMSPSNPYIARKMKNRVSIKSKTLEETEQKVIFSLEDTITVLVGETITIPCWFFTSPCNDIQNSVITKHGDITLDNEAKYNYATFLTFTNGGGTDREITAIEIEGKPLVEKGITLADEKDTSLITEFGEKLLAIENPYIQGYDFARSLAEDLLTINKNPQAEIVFKAKSMPYLQIGDRIEVDYTKYNIVGEQYKIIGITIDCKEAVIDTIRARTVASHVTELEILIIEAGAGTLTTDELIFVENGITKTAEEVVIPRNG